MPCSTFHALAIRTWHRMHANLTTPIWLREDGITSLNLQDIYLLLRKQVLVIDFSPYVESHKTGADWEWWFLGHKSVFGAAVQAKCLSPKNTYDVGYIPSYGYPQIDRLLDYSLANSLAPLYCFYNWWNPTNAPQQWPCRSYPQQEELWGCALADGWTIYQHHLANQYSAGALTTDCEPWHCIVCCDPVSTDPSERALGVMRRLSAGRLHSPTVTTYKQRDIPDVQSHNQLPQRITRVIQLAREGNVLEAAKTMGENAPKQLLIIGDIQRHF